MSIGNRSTNQPLQPPLTVFPAANDGRRGRKLLRQVVYSNQNSRTVNTETLFLTHSDTIGSITTAWNPRMGGPLWWVCPRQMVVAGRRLSDPAQQRRPAVCICFIGRSGLYWTRFFRHRLRRVRFASSTTNRSAASCSDRFVTTDRRRLSYLGPETVWRHLTRMNPHHSAVLDHDSGYQLRDTTTTVDSEQFLCSVLLHKYISI